jgi:hypothetical protein
LAEQVAERLIEYFSRWLDFSLICARCLSPFVANLIRMLVCAVRAIARKIQP